MRKYRKDSNFFIQNNSLIFLLHLFNTAQQFLTEEYNPGKEIKNFMTGVKIKLHI